MGVCWDRHRLWITRELVRAGAQIVLMPVDDDFNHSRWFPAFHASDSVFRAVENRVALGLGTTNGISLVVDPYGRVMAESGINERTAIIGKIFTVSGTTLYTRFGDWFGWLMVVGVVTMVGSVVFSRLRGNGVGPK
jgi:apolipoprotein N-acyltransferase